MSSRYLFRGRFLGTNVVSEPFASNGFFSGSTLVALSKYVTVLKNEPTAAQVTNQRELTSRT
jgi:hypothetical protein